METKRIEWIDYLKAFTCFLVVLGHALQSFQISGIISNVHISETIIMCIYLFHMPLFMCISGILYSLKSDKILIKGEYRKFVARKIINLLVPYITFYLAFIALNMMFAGSVNNARGINDLLRIFYNPLAPYWFLYSLAIMFILIPLFERKIKNKRVIFLIFLILRIIYAFKKLDIFIIDTFMQYAVYFYIGNFIKTKNNNHNMLINVICIIGYIILSVVYVNLQVVMTDTIISLINIVFAFIGIYLCTDIFKKIKYSKILDTFKNYTLQIFLTHTIFAAGMRIFLLKIGITNSIVHIAVGLITSIYVPVIMSKISEKIKYTQFLFYPINTIEELRMKKRNNHENINS